MFELMHTLPQVEKTPIPYYFLARQQKEKGWVWVHFSMADQFYFQTDISIPYIFIVAGIFSLGKNTVNSAYYN